MKVLLHEIVELLGAKTDADLSLEIAGLSKIEEGKPGTITFFSNPKYLPFVYTTQATAILVPIDFQPKGPISSVLLFVKDPYSAFSILLELAQKMLGDKKGIHPQSFISASATLGEDVYSGPFSYVGEGTKIGNRVKIYPNVFIGDFVEIEDDSTLFPNVVVYHGCKIGKNCIIHSSAVIGSDGFGFAPQENGAFKKIPQTGIVRIENNVEIGSGTTIDRATIGETLIRNGVKIDNLVQIAHNVEIGENTVIAAQAGISGSTRIGKHCMIGGQVGIVGHIQIADYTKIGAQSGVSKTIEKSGLSFRGSPAQDYNQQLRSEALFRQLEKMEIRLRQLEKNLINSDPES